MWICLINNLLIVEQKSQNNGINNIYIVTITQCKHSGTTKCINRNHNW
jgi:hypothetical protein